MLLKPKLNSIKVAVKLQVTVINQGKIPLIKANAHLDNVQVLWLRINSIFILSDKDERARNSKHFCCIRVEGFGPRICCFTDFLTSHLTMHIFLWVFKAADHLSNSEHLLLKDYCIHQDYLLCKTKWYLIIFSQGSYGSYPAGNFMFRDNNSKASTI